MTLRFPLVHLFSSLIFLCFLACTPKAAGPTTGTTTTPPTTTPKPTADANLSPCKKFSDTPNPGDATDNYVIYRQMLKGKDMKGAMKYWRKVYAISPAADGKRPTVYSDGVVFYTQLAKDFPDRKETYGDTILMLYQEARRCYPGNGYMAAIQGFDSYYTYPGSATDDEIYALFKESIEIDGAEKLNYFIINPMSKLVVEQHRDGKIDVAEAKVIVIALKTRLAKGLAECKGAACTAWNTINAYAPETLRYFETVEDFYGCQYYIDQYYGEYKENPTDCDAIRTAYSRLRYGKCAEGTPELDELKAAYETNCRVIVNSGPSTLKEAFNCLESGEYNCAIEKFEQAANETDDAEKKGRYFLYVAKVYYSHKRNFGQARSYARKAAAADPNTGEPYMLIGTLYASSGPLCGPGTGFDSQIVTWPAIDKWQQAKRIQPDLANKANKLINRYTQYMPSKSDIFQRGIKVGDSFKVECWIQETTRVRTP
jgi:tetratricopeptide (TPR) repeat protein